MGYLRPTGGHGIRSTAWIAIANRSKCTAAFRTCPAKRGCFAPCAARDVIDFFTAVRRDGSRPRAVALASDRFGLDLSRGVSAMSTGMRQKLALAVTLAVDTPLVILDEPTSNLDPTVRSDVAALVLEAKRAGRTVIFSSHVISEVEQVCDRVIILRRGRVVHTQVIADAAPQASHSRAVDRPPAAGARIFQRARDRGHRPAGDLMIETPGELSGLLGWLATLPLAEVNIEPVGLRALYDQYHAS